MASRRKKEPKPRRRAAEPAVEAEAIEEVSGGMGFDDGIVIATTLLLVGALALVIIAAQAYPTSPGA